MTKSENNDQKQKDELGGEKTQAEMDHIMEYDRVSKIPVSVLLFEIAGHLEKLTMSLDFIGNLMEEEKKKARIPRSDRMARKRSGRSR